MADILVVPLKKTSEVDLVKPLKKLIALLLQSNRRVINFFRGSRIRADNPENFNDAIGELNKLRSLACVRAVDKNESALEVAARWVTKFLFLSVLQ